MLHVTRCVARASVQFCETKTTFSFLGSDGIWSVTTMFCASEGPPVPHDNWSSASQPGLLYTYNVNRVVRCGPPFSVSTVLSIQRSALVSTSVSAEAELLPATGSIVVDETLAVLWRTGVSGRPARTRGWMVT